MKTSQFQFSEKSGWQPEAPSPNEKASLVLLFGDPQLIRSKVLMKPLRECFTKAVFLVVPLLEKF